MAMAFDVLVDAQPISEASVLGFVVERDLDQPGMCVVTLRNARHEQNNRFKLGNAVEVKVGSDQSSAEATLFKGELIGMEPSYRQGGESELSLRAFDKLHQLPRSTVKDLSEHQRPVHRQRDRRSAWSLRTVRLGTQDHPPAGLSA